MMALKYLFENKKLKKMVKQKKSQKGEFECDIQETVTPNGMICNNTDDNTYFNAILENWPGENPFFEVTLQKDPNTNVTFKFEYENAQWVPKDDTANLNPDGVKDEFKTIFTEDELQCAQLLIEETISGAKTDKKPIRGKAIYSGESSSLRTVLDQYGLKL